jgi:hypothetical protein
VEWHHKCGKPHLTGTQLVEHRSRPGGEKCHVIKSQSNYITALYSTTMFVASLRQIPLKDNNWPPGEKITQAAEASL